MDSARLLRAFTRRRLDAAPLARLTRFARSRTLCFRRHWRGFCVGVASAYIRRRPGAALLARWSRFARSPAHRRRHWLLRDFCVQPASARFCASCPLGSPSPLVCSPPSPKALAWRLRAGSVSLVLRRLRAGRALFVRTLRRRRWRWLDFYVQLALARCCVVCMMVSLRSPACSPLPPLASVRLLRAAGVGSVLRHLHAGLALLACVLTTVAAGICEAFACSRPWLGAAPLALWSRLAWLRPRRRRRWLRRGLCVQLAPARCCATGMLVLMTRQMMHHWPAGLAVGLGAVGLTPASARHRLSTRRSGLAPRRRRWLRRGLCVQLASSPLRFSTR